MNLPGSKSRHQGNQLATTSLQKRFLDKVNRTLFRYGKARGRSSMTLKREGLLIIHTDEYFMVMVNEQELFHYTKANAQSANDGLHWASEKKLREGMRRIDNMFILDDLANL